jgi:hypothetical protein
MVLNTEALRSGKASYADLVRDINHSDLYKFTDKYFDTIQSIIVDVKDKCVTFVPRDAALKDAGEQAFTLGHVLTHLTASLEETASIGAVLARGIAFEGRLRYEVHARLKESQRICHASLDAWPDAPHLDLTVTRIPSFGPMNAIGIHMLGIVHGESHFEQLREIMRQSKEQA